MFSDLGVVNYWGFVLASTIVVLLPGPNSLYALSAGAQFGPSKGVMAAAGVFCGDFVLIAASILGVAAALKSHPAAFFALKAAGALYLAWLGAGMLAHAARGWFKGPKSGIVGKIKMKPHNTYVRAFTLSVLNPKAIIFYFSIMTQFVRADSAANPLWAFVALGCTMEAISMVYLSALAFAGESLARSVSGKPRLVSALAGAASLLFLFFAFALLFEKM